MFREERAPNSREKFFYIVTTPYNSSFLNTARTVAHSSVTGIRGEAFRRYVTKIRKRWRVCEWELCIRKCSETFCYFEEPGKLGTRRLIVPSRKWYRRYCFPASGGTRIIRIVIRTFLRKLRHSKKTWNSKEALKRLARVRAVNKERLIPRNEQRFASKKKEASNWSANKSLDLKLLRFVDRS